MHYEDYHSLSLISDYAEEYDGSKVDPMQPVMKRWVIGEMRNSELKRLEKWWLNTEMFPGGFATFLNFISKVYLLSRYGSISEAADRRKFWIR